MKRLKFLCITALLFICACSGNKQQLLKDQEQMIRNVYPDRAQTASWENYVKYHYIAASKFADVLPPMGKPFFELLWSDAKAKGYYQEVFDKVKAAKDTAYAKPYIEFMAFYYSDYFDEEQPSDVELMYNDFRNVGRYEINPKAEEILEYALGRIKFNTPKPVITSIEHIDDNQYGEGGYWLVHLEDGENRKLRFFTTDAGTQDFDQMSRN